MTKEKTGVAEWAGHSFNFQIGCKNGCEYCYARRMAKRFMPDKDFESPTQHLTKSAQALLSKRVGNVIMFPTMHDVDEENKFIALEYLKRLLQLENRVLWVTKGGNAAMWILCNLERTHGISNLEVRVTIGSLKNHILKRWEPNAPSLTEREMVLFKAVRMGVKCSVSCEPMLDGKLVDIAMRYQHTSSVWFGFMNNHDHNDPFVPTPDFFELKKLVELQGHFLPGYIQFKDSVKKALSKHPELLKGGTT